MKFQSIFIDEINVGTRRREDYGDIDALAESISHFGLIQPIVVDEQFNLIAGGRRLKACQKLKLEKIDARFYSELSEDERRELELEENIRRKDLTSHERSRQLITNAETMEDLISSTVEEIKKPEKNPKNAGRKPKGKVSKKDVADALGVSEGTLINAEQHVAAVEEFPELANIPTQKDALTIASNLRKLPEPEKKKAREALAENDQDVLADLAERPRLIRQKKTPGEKWTRIIYEIRKMFASIHSLGGVDELTKSWDAQEKKAYLANVREMIDELRQIESALSGAKHDRQAKRKVA